MQGGSECATPLAGHTPRWPRPSLALQTPRVQGLVHPSVDPQYERPVPPGLLALGKLRWRPCLHTLPTSRLLSGAAGSGRPAFGSPVWFLNGHPVSLVEPLMMTPKEVGSLPAYWVPLPVGRPCHPGTDMALMGYLCRQSGRASCNERVFTAALPSGSPRTTEGAKTPYASAVTQNAARQATPKLSAGRQEASASCLGVGDLTRVSLFRPGPAVSAG